MNIRVLNILGGSLFAGGLMLGFQTFINHEGDLTRRTINDEGKWIRLTIISQNRVLDPEELKPDEEQRKSERESFQSMRIMMIIASIQATLGAGLACLRESRD